MMLTWILLFFCILKSQSALIRKEKNNIDNGAQINNTKNNDGNLDNIENLHLQDTTPGLKEKAESVKKEGHDLEETLFNNIIYQQSAWEQLVASVDQWEFTGVLGKKLRAISPSQVENEDASDLLDHILDTVKPFLNNTNIVEEDPGTALNMHNCSVEGVMEGLKRDGPATLTVNDDIATLTFTITTDTLSMSCDWYQWVIIKYYGVVSAKLSTITVETVVEMKLQPDQHPVIKKMTVKQLGDISSDISGVGPLGILVRTIINKIIDQYRVMIIDGLEQQAPIVVQASLDNITISNSHNLKTDKEREMASLRNKENSFSALNNGIDYQQNINHIEDKEEEKNISKSTEKIVEKSVEYNGNGDNNIETQVQSTNYDRINEENDLLLLNDYGNNVHPKLKQAKKTKVYKKEEETDLNLLNDSEKYLNPKFKKKVK